MCNKVDQKLTTAIISSRLIFSLARQLSFCFYLIYNYFLKTFFRNERVKFFATQIRAVISESAANASATRSTNTTQVTNNNDV